MKHWTNVRKYRKTIEGKEWVLDLKSSYEPSLSWRVQTAAYAIGLWGEKYRKSRNKRAIVHLHADASYDLLIHEDPMDELLWKVALDLACIVKAQKSMLPVVIPQE